MGSEWKEYRLEDIAEVIDSLHKSPAYVEHGYSMVRVTDIQTGFLNLKTTYKVTKEVFDEFTKKYKPKKEDIVFSRVGSYGVSSYVVTDEPFCLGQNTIVINPKINSRFLYYVLQSKELRHQIESVTVGTTQKTISLKNIKNLLISCPPDSEIEYIAHILGSLDDKIELNRQMNATLEAMAQALFKSWFVDFDPVLDNALATNQPIPDELQAKAQARLALGAARKPLPPEIQSLFPNRFVLHEEMGWIPEGWEVTDFSQIASINTEAWSNKNNPDFVNYVDLSNAKNGRISEIITYAFNEAPSRARRILRRDDTIIGLVRPANKSFAYIFKEGLTGSTGFAVMRPKKSYYRSFVYLSLTLQDTIDYFAHIADGGAYPAIRPEVVISY